MKFQKLNGINKKIACHDHLIAMVTLLLLEQEPATSLLY